MIYIHYCRQCDRLRMQSGHKKSCPACGHPLKELDIPYESFSLLPTDKREALRKEIRDKTE